MVGVRVLAVVLLSFGIGGCGSIRLPSSLVPLVPSALRPPSDVPAPTLNARVPTADQLAAPYREQAERHERHGRLRQAVEARMTALAFAPNHESSRLALKRLRDRIDREVAEHLRRGWHAVAADSDTEARRHFLAALALDPDSRAAHDAMRATPATPRPELEPKTRMGVVRSGTPIASEPKLRESPKPQGDSNAGKMPTVITKSTSAPAPHPPQGEVTDKPEALYAAATTHLAARRDEDAYRALAQLDRVSPGYGDSAALLHDLRARLVRHRYQNGMRLFREELLEDAIEQWRGVLGLDPMHVEARRNIDQAEKMLRFLAAQQKRGGPAQPSAE